MSYNPPPLVEYEALPPSERLARLWHEAYERLAAEYYGYLPRPWEELTEADQALHVSVAEEMISRQNVYLPPSASCTHDLTVLRRNVEARQCVRCGAFPTLSSNPPPPPLDSPYWPVSRRTGGTI